MTLPVALDPNNVGNAPGDGPLRAGGSSTVALPRSGGDLPNWRSEDVKEMAEDVELVRDVWEGTRELRSKSGTYLPQNPGEPLPMYQNRVKRAVLFNIFRGTIEGLTGYMFRLDPKLGDDVPPAIVAHWENIDNAGTHGDVFVQDMTKDAMMTGHAAILVEFPKTEGRQTAAEDGGPGGAATAQATIRPYWVPIEKEQILSWRTVVEQGRTYLAQIVIEECADVPDGQFGTKEEKRYRVFTRTRATPTAPPVVSFQLLQILSNNTVAIVDEGTYPTQDEIPIAELRTAGSEELFESDPPFLDIAELNLAHFRQWSDYDTYQHKTCCPIYSEAGVEASELPLDGTPAPPLVLGPNTARRSTNPDFKTWYTAPDGASLAEVRASLQELKSAMAERGLAALASSKRTAETATAKELDKGATDSSLAKTARGIQDGVERALGFHARYLRLTDGGSIQINRDYGLMQMDAAMMQAWGNLAKDLKLPVRFVLERLRDGGRIPEGEDLDALEQEILAQMAAEEAQRQQTLQDQRAAVLAATNGGTGQ